MKALLASAAAVTLAMGASTALAQGAVNSIDDKRAMNAQQSAMYDSWPETQRMTYDNWPMEAQNYYWTLDTDQQRGWWMLNDEQRARILQMNPQQQTAAWTAIRNQMNGASNNMASNNMASNTRTAGMSNVNVQWVSNPVVQATPNDAGPPTGNVPICNKTDYDNCINAWEAGKRGPNVTRPLSYWPGPKNDPRAGE